MDNNFYPNNQPPTDGQAAERGFDTPNQPTAEPLQPQQADPSTEENQGYSTYNYSGGYTSANYQVQYQPDPAAQYQSTQYQAPYGYTQQSYSPTPEPPKKKNGSGGKKVLAAVLAVVIAIGCFAGGILLKDNLFPDSPTMQDPQGTTEGNAPPVQIPEDQDPVFIPDDEPEETLNVKEVYANNVNSVVGISLEGETYNIFGQISAYASSGTGFIIREDGYILTNYHVVKSESLSNPTITVTLYNGEKHTATVVGYHETSDVALIKVEAKGLTPVSIGDSNKLLAGESVAIIGHPLGELTYSVSRGIVSAVNRELAVEDTTLTLFQIDASVNSGNSGGPCFNEHGQVVGIVTSKYASSSIEGLGFCIPINDAVKIANDLLNYGFVRGQAGLGVEVKAVYRNMGGYYQQVPFGLQVQKVVEGGCCDRAGIKPGDIIIAIDSQSVTTISQLTNAKSRYKAGDNATLKVYRDGVEMEFDVTFDEFVPQHLTQDPSVS